MSFLEIEARVETVRCRENDSDGACAGYSLEMEHPVTGHRSVEIYAALPAVIARAAQLIEAGYIIGIWSPTSFEGR
jgi:hypothetical protein